MIQCYTQSGHITSPMKSYTVDTIRNDDMVMHHQGNVVVQKIPITINKLISNDLIKCSGISFVK